MIRRNWQIQIDMDQPIPESVWPEGIQLRIYNHELDGKALYKVDEDAIRDT